jgi:hypothetical protein
LFGKLFDVVYGFVDLFLPLRRLGDDPGDGLSMPGDDDGLAALHLIEEPGKMGFGFGGLNFSRHGCLDRSIDLVKTMLASLDGVKALHSR